MLFFQHKVESKQVAWLDSHAYTNDEKSWYPGVTTILGVISKGVQFEEWLKNNGRNADWIIERAMRNGSDTHQLIQDFNTDPEKVVTYIGYDEVGKPFEIYNKDVWTMFNRYIDFYSKHRPEMIAVESVLCSPQRGYGGQLDFVCYLHLKPVLVKDKWVIMPSEQKVRWLIDNKTGNIYKESKLQTAAYAVMWNDYFPDMKIQATAVLELDASTRSEGRSGAVQGQGWSLRLHGNYREYMKLYSAFKHVFETWKWENPTWKPYFVQYPDQFSRKLIDEQPIKTDKDEQRTDNAH